MFKVFSYNANTPMDNLRQRKRKYRATKRSIVHNALESMFKPNKYTLPDICQSMNSFCKEFITRAFDKLMKATREAVSNLILPYSL
jgi:hypothetical protein